MDYQVVFYTDEHNIRVRYSPYLYKRFREMPSARHFAANPDMNREHNEFWFSKTPQLAFLLHLTCVDLPRQWREAGFHTLVEQGKTLTYNRYRANNQETFEGPAIEKLEGFEIDGWHYQDEAYARAEGTNGIGLFMEPGCGKSKVVIDYIINHPEVRRVLIIGPNRVIEEGEWMRQFERHWPDEARSYELLSLVKGEHGSVANRAAVLKSKTLFILPNMVQVVLINYESIWRKPIADVLLDRKFDVCAMDESHRIKTAGSKVSKFAERLGDAVPAKFLLTGTPYPNNPLDIFGQFRFLDKTIFGTNFNAFKNKYALFGGFEGRKFLGMNPDTEEEFEQKLAAFSIRVKQRPFPVADEILYYDLPPAAMRKYSDMETDFYTYINGREVEASNVLAQLMRLQQIAAGFTPIYENVKQKDGTERRKVIGWDRVHEAKKDFLKDLLEDLPKEKPIVVFALLHEHMDDVRRATQAVKHRGQSLRYGEVSGRQSDYQRYMNDEIDVLCIQVVSGSEGLNELVKSDIGIFYATGYYLGKFIQARARLARPGQDSDRILFYHIHGRGTIETIIYDTLLGKESLVARFMPKHDPPSLDYEFGTEKINELSQD